MTIGEKIKAIRKERQLSQQKLQQRSGVERNSISLIENNHRSPSFKTLEKLARAMGVTVGYITNYSRHENYSPVDTIPSEELLVMEPAAMPVRNSTATGYLSLPIIKEQLMAQNPMHLLPKDIDDHILIPDTWVKKEQNQERCRCCWIETKEKSFSPLIEVDSLVCVDTQNRNPNLLSGKIVALAGEFGGCFIRRLQLQSGFLIGIPGNTSQQQALCIPIGQKTALIGKVVWYWSRLDFPPR